MKPNCINNLQLLTKKILFELKVLVLEYWLSSNLELKKY